MAERKANRSARNKLHGKYLFDIFESNVHGIEVIRRFFRAVIRCFETTNFNSVLVQKYFSEISIWKTKKYLRMSLLVLSYCIFIHIAEAGLLAPLPHRFPVTLLIAILWIYMGVYITTFRNLDHNTYVYISMFVCLINIFFILWTKCGLLHENSILYIPYFGLIIIMCELLPIPMDLNVCTLLLLFISTLLQEVTILDTIHPKSLKDILKTNKITWELFDLFTLIKTVHIEERSITHILQTEGILWLTVFMMANYLRFWKEVRNKLMFLKLGKSVQARDKCEKSLLTRIRWIEAIMPKQVTYEYQQLERMNRDLDNNLWVYNKSFNSVSILFADIVGFTQMSSNKTAYQVVMLLNDLFNRFDDLCLLTKCEKIGTLGDCYYCVAGCPEPRSDHAMSCVEMGLGMCRIIKVFNCDHHQSVSMRVGVHSGRVNAAIIGAQRFRYDVYSYDVLIANEMESTGKPGRVHISQSTYDEVKDFYNVSRGEDVFVKQEQTSGIAGMVLVKTSIKTYFVDPRSSKLRVKHESFGSKQIMINKVDQDDENIKETLYGDIANEALKKEGAEKLGHRKTRKYNVPRTTSVERISRSSSVQRISITSYFGKPRPNERDRTMEYVKHRNDLERSINLIKSLQSDPEKQVNLFKNPPMNPFTFRFLDPETEWHYQTHTQECVDCTYIDSLKVAPLADAIALLFIDILILIMCLVAHRNPDVFILKKVLYTLSTAVLGLFCFFCLAFQSTIYAEQINNKHVKLIYSVLSYPIIREILIGLNSFIPTLLYLTFRWYSKIEDNIPLINKLEGICILTHCIPTSSAYLSRLIFALLSFFAIFQTKEKNSEYNTYICLRDNDIQQGFPLGRLQVLSIMEMCCCLFLVILISRENESNCRICFYVSRESEITSDLAQNASNEAQSLLYNIIPKYVFMQLQVGELDLTKVSFSYAVLVQNVGVVFACITNFFSSYYREDYKGGEGALKLLNSIICAFDNLLKRPELKDVEKIKTVNDCYMAAAGLNHTETSRNLNKYDHLIALMDYCHLLKETMTKLNDMYIVGTDNFIVKIGYNFGPVMAGIIGTTKPMYDIWGDTVNVASRLYSNGLPNCIQVSEQTVELLKYHFDFEYRGEVFLKGKGNVTTFICIQRKIKG